MPHISRNWGSPARLISKTPGKIAKSLRAFGVEVECQYSYREQLDNLVETIDSAIGIKGDGSINGTGAEICTPPSSGEKAEEMIKTLCEGFEKNQFRVDNSCGLHVHIDARDLYDMPYEFMQKYWLLIIAFDPVVRSFLTLNRRNNSFCMEVEHVFTAVKKAKSMHELQTICHSSNPSLVDLRWRLSKGKNASRYRGFNLLPFFNLTNPNVEIRYHNGTLRASQILRWANLHCLIMDKIVDGTLSLGWIQTMYRKRSIRNKTEALFQMIGLDKTSEIYFKARQITYYKKYGFDEMELIEAEANNLTTH